MPVSRPCHCLFLGSLLVLGAIALPALATAQTPPTPGVPTLPPDTDIPEEILRTQIILDGRSPNTGEALSAADYAAQDAATAASLDQPGVITGQIAQLVFLLRVRKAVRLVLPIIP